MCYSKNGVQDAYHFGSALSQSFRRRVVRFVTTSFFFWGGGGGVKESIPISSVVTWWSDKLNIHDAVQYGPVALLIT